MDRQVNKGHTSLLHHNIIHMKKSQSFEKHSFCRDDLASVYILCSRGMHCRRGVVTLCMKLIAFYEEEYLRTINSLWTGFLPWIGLQGPIYFTYIVGHQVSLRPLWIRSPLLPHLSEIMLYIIINEFIPLVLLDLITYPCTDMNSGWVHTARSSPNSVFTKTSLMTLSKFHDN